MMIDEFKLSRSGNVCNKKLCLLLLISATMVCLLFSHYLRHAGLPNYRNDFWINSIHEKKTPSTIGPHTFQNSRKHSPRASPLYITTSHSSNLPNSPNVIPNASKKPSADFMGLLNEEVITLTSHSEDSDLFPNSSDPYENRVIKQLSYVPPKTPTFVKKILIPHLWDDISMGRKAFYDFRCKVTECTISDNINDTLTADLVLLSDKREAVRPVARILKNNPRRLEQIWVFFTHESPLHSCDTFEKLAFNWTVTYSATSTVPDLYGAFYPITPNVISLPQTRDFAAGKTGKVLWFVSNCDTPNKRLEYAKELAKHIQVDIYGKCGKPDCPRDMFLADCMIEMISKYKFYLSFENSNCDTYITEKFFRVALTNDIIPVVMGALPEVYRRLSPPHSHIHVEQFSGAKQLADYLHKLDRNATLYNEYFQWKGAWKYFPMLNWICRLCALLHAPRRTITMTFRDWQKTEHCRKPVKPKQ